MESPLMEKKFSGSQKQVGPPSGGFSQQAIQRHNFLLPKDEQSSTIQLGQYRGQ